MHVNVTALKIHMSEEAHDALSAFPEFTTEPRGDISVKVSNDYNVKYFLCTFFVKSFIKRHLTRMDGLT